MCCSAAERKTSILLLIAGFTGVSTLNGAKQLKINSDHCLLNLSIALVLFANPAIYASSSPISCKYSFLTIFLDC